MKIIFTLLISFSVLLISETVLFAQNSPKEPFIAPDNASGEETVRELEMIVQDSIASKERLFVIAHRGAAESSNQISLARLNYAKLFLLKMRRFVLSQNPIFAEGERIKGEGRIEFYLGSRLRLVTLAKRNRIPNLTCCPDYYPPAKRKRRDRKS